MMIPGRNTMRGVIKDQRKEYVVAIDGNFRRKVPLPNLMRVEVLEFETFEYEDFWEDTVC
jgi:hypothetical protein